MAQKKGILLILISALMFGSYGVWSRLLGSSFDIFYQSWTRSLIITLLIIPILIIKKEIVPIHKKDRKWMFAYMSFTSFTQVPLYYAFNNMDIGTATILFFTSMLLTMYFFGFLFLGEKITRVKLASFILACFGLLTTFTFSLASFSILAAAMALLNGVASGSEISSSKKLTGNYSTLYMALLSWSVIFITNLPISLLLGETQHLPTLSITWLFHLGYIFAGLIGYWTIIEGLKYTEASIGGLIGLLEVVFSIAFGILIFNEALTIRTVIGALLVLSAAALPHVVELKNSRHSPTTTGEEVV